MTHHGTGWVRFDFIVPSRGLIGFRTQFHSDTAAPASRTTCSRGTQPWSGPMRMRPTGSLVADRTGVASAYAMFNLQERGTLFVAPGTEVYEGMLVGENSRADDMDVNITREREARPTSASPPVRNWNAWSRRGSSASSRLWNSATTTSAPRSPPPRSGSASWSWTPRTASGSAPAAPAASNPPARWPAGQAPGRAAGFGPAPGQGRTFRSGSRYGRRFRSGLRLAIAVRDGPGQGVEDDGRPDLRTRRQSRNPAEDVLRRHLGQVGVQSRANTPMIASVASVTVSELKGRAASCSANP